MAWYNINKGIGKQVEFKGLRAQYLFIFAGGLLGVFILFVAMYLLGVPTAVCIAVGLVLGTALVAFTFYLNGRYGAHGLMKLSAVGGGGGGPRARPPPPRPGRPPRTRPTPPPTPPPTQRPADADDE